MPLPTDFVASATALECYAACARRFRHKYIDRLPAAGLDDSFAAGMRRGTVFHRLVVWDNLGLDTSLILDAEEDPGLVDVWENYCEHRPRLFEGQVQVLHDLVLTARCGPVSVQARLDALAFGPDGEITIYDWKTGLYPNRTRLAGSPQSKVYPYVVWNTPSIVEGLHGDDAAGISLVYWFPEEPDDPLRIQCDAGFLDDAAGWLSGAIDMIVADKRFDMTLDRRMCSTCEYLAHCGVRAKAGGDVPLDENYYVPFHEDEEPSSDLRWDV